jgi:hypothetical protein
VAGVYIAKPFFDSRCFPKLKKLFRKPTSLRAQIPVTVAVKGGSSEWNVSVDNGGEEEV